MNTLKSQMNATAAAFESILTAKMSFGSLVAARSSYMHKLDDFQAEADRLGLTSVSAQLSQAKADVSTAQSPALVRLAADSI